MDILSIRRKSAHQIIQKIIAEAWSPERKKEITRNFIQRGFTFVDHVQAGDFDVSLWSYPDSGLLTDVYAVALNNGQNDPGDMATQFNPNVKRNPGGPWKMVIYALIKWTQRYGKLLISSGNPAKINQYRRLLHRHFETIDYTLEDGTCVGFYILPN